MMLRLARKTDLPFLKEMYKRLIDDMHGKGVCIWNEWYPYTVFEEDIDNNQLYLLTNEDTVQAGFVVYEDESAKNKYDWFDQNAKAMYIGRVGVNVDFLRQGVGAEVIKCAKEIAKEKGAEYLRLDVVDINYPAIKLYEKHGFKRVGGEHTEYIKERGITLHEYGYELKLD